MEMDALGLFAIRQAFLIFFTLAKGITIKAMSAPMRHPQYAYRQGELRPILSSPSEIFRLSFEKKFSSCWFFLC